MLKHRDGYLSFWWECTKEAVEGSLSKANAAAQVFGTLMLVIVFVKLGWEMDAPATITGTLELGIVATIASIILAWITIFFIRLLGAPVRFYQKAKQEIETRENEITTIKAQHSPKIAVFLSEVDGGIQEVETCIREQGKTPRMGWSKWVQVSVSCATEAALEECEVWMTGVERIAEASPGEKLLAEDARCKWSQYDSGRSISIRPLRTQRANLFSLYQGSPDLRVEADFVKFRLRDGIQQRGKYLVTLVASAQGDTRSELRSFIFEWHDYNNISLKPAVILEDTSS
jgi:hypothetical protein